MSDLLGNPLALFPIMAAIFYFVLWRPQQQEAKEAQKLIAGLVRGDKVVTTAGIHATVHEARDATLVLEIATNTYMTVDRDTVKRKVVADATPAGAAPGAAAPSTAAKGGK
ncbi:MAG: preprotein translocase subunit YajC [Myxococcales bacterium]|nr:preprotein translocase subunit YajC [Myxococcales bacterium]